MKTRSWERAEKIKREIENGTIAQKQIGLSQALDAFIADCEARNLSQATLRKYSYLCSRLREFSAASQCRHLGDFTTESVRAFRSFRTSLSPRTSGKELERIRTFFSFCVQNDWIAKNPATTIKAPEVKPNPTLPFSDAEVSKILATADFRSQVFFRILLHSGLRIIDAAMLRPERIQNGRVFLYTQKTGVPVFVPVPPDLLTDLGNLALTAGYYFAVESDKPSTVAEYYRIKLRKAAHACGVKNAHPHRWRDTFAVRLLEKGVPLETVSILLGHTDLKTTQRAYYPWIKSLQDNLERAVALTWTPTLVRVK